MSVGTTDPFDGGIRYDNIHIRHCFVHWDYDRNRLGYYDIAMIDLPFNLTFSRKVGAIEMVDKNFTLKSPSPVTVMGYGSWSPAGGATVAHLQTKTVQTMSGKECAAEYHANSEYILDENMIFCIHRNIFFWDHISNGDSGSTYISLFSLIFISSIILIY